MTHVALTLPMSMSPSGTSPCPITPISFAVVATLSCVRQTIVSVKNPNVRVAAKSYSLGTPSNYAAPISINT
jgi:hypothetical protein